MKLIKTTLYALGGLLLLVLVMGVATYRSDISSAKLERKYLKPESKFLQIMDAKMHIRDQGAGTPIFLIHGSFASLHTWEPWENELKKNYRTISMDLPGHGITGPNSNQNYSQNYYRDLVFALADTLRIDSFYVAGNSMGGNVAWRMALQNPDRVKKLILVDAAVTVKPPQTDDASKSSTPINRSRPWIFSVIANPTWGKLLTRFTPRFLFGLNLKQVYENDSLITDELVDRYYELLLRDGNREATIKRLTNRQNLFSEVDETIKVPTLILWGAKDTWIPLVNGQRLNKAIPGSQLIIFSNAGHVPHEELPSETIKPVINFLNPNPKQTVSDYD